MKLPFFGGKWLIFRGEVLVSGKGKLTWRIIPLNEWLGSPPFTSHEVRPFGRGPTTRSLGDFLTMVIDHLRPSWDDPPSSHLNQKICARI